MGSLSAQTVVGLEWVTRFGLTLRADVGYTRLLTNNLSVTGELPERTAREASLWYGSGASVGLAAGWTF